jgi:hypothetical protein
MRENRRSETDSELAAFSSASWLPLFTAERVLYDDAQRLPIGSGP